MSGFIKLYGHILDSSVWQLPLATKVMWITMMAAADKDGQIQASVPGLAARAGVSIAECEAALECFLSPDPYSRTETHEGRRAVKIPGGWELLNHGMYREMRSSRQKREATRIATKRAEKCNVAPDPRSQIPNTDPDPERPDPRATRESLSAGIFDAPTIPSKPASTWKPPKGWRPNADHELRVRELKLDMENLYRTFRHRDWNRPYSDWNDRFSLYIEEAKILRETRQFKDSKR